jgi:predicted TIM-barrel fold metal-dependent hydrolase
MAQLPFVDTHVHFWDLKDPKLRYVWLEPDWIHPVLGNIDALKVLLYGADQFVAETRFQNVTKAVHVQAAIGIDDPIEETAWLQAQADRTGFPHGIVGHCDLAGGEVERTLERHLQYANFRGVRDFGEGDYLTNPAWQRGYGKLAAHDLVFCLDTEVEQMGKARKLADAYPDVVLCVDHAGFPRRRDDEYYEAWRSGMAQLAGAPNVVCKISGLGMCDNAWTVESIRPWVLSCIDAFGIERSFFGSNWPVDHLYSSYGDVTDAYATIIADFAPHEQSALFSGNAERVFRL